MLNRHELTLTDNCLKTDRTCLKTDTHSLKSVSVRDLSGDVLDWLYEQLHEELSLHCKQNVAKCASAKHRPRWRQIRHVCRIRTFGTYPRGVSVAAIGVAMKSRASAIAAGGRR